MEICGNPVNCETGFSINLSRLPTFGLGGISVFAEKTDLLCPTKLRQVDKKKIKEKKYLIKFLVI
jgi:hypothetical protein